VGEITVDARVGMAFSNIVAFFIILTTAATLHASNASIRIQTAADAAKALQPLAGRFASLLFALGIIGTGMLAIPVLAGSAAYAVSELFGWRASLESKPGKARKFYYVLSGATILGVCLNFAGIDPIRALFLSAGVNGIVAVPLMFSLMLISEKPAIVGKFVLPRYLRVAGWIATAVMLVASLGFLVTALPQWLAR
jgi:Mn2+/Fe2+ NRAMP family transporter